MPHDSGLIATLAAAFGLAMVLGYAMTRLRLPPLVGYLLAGVALGPATPGFTGNVALAGELAEIGVMLLMFGVGLHFSLADLLAVRRLAIPGALIGISVSSALGALLARFWDWEWPAAVVFGLCLSVASTVVLLRALEARNLLQSVNGQIAVGWLVVEDLLMVLVLVLLPALAGGAAAAKGAAGWQALALTGAKLGAFVVLMLVVGTRVLPALLWRVARTGSRELFTLTVIAVAVGVAFGAAEFFDVSFALGAFFAGMILRESEYSHRAADESLPLRDAFAVLFFVSVGMLFDPAVLWQEPLKLLGLLAIIMVGKPLAAALFILLARYPLNTALTVGTSLAQIGEFSFILAGLGATLGILPPEARSLILAAALIAISCNSALFAAVEPLQRWVRERSALARRLELRDDPLAQLPMSTDESLLSGQAVLVGYGRVGRRVATMLRERGIPFVVAEQNREQVEALRAAGTAAVCGDAATPEVLIQAHIARAAVLIVTVPDTLAVTRMVETARILNPPVKVLLRAHDDEEALLLAGEGVDRVFTSEETLASGMAAEAIRQLQPGRQA